jgi:hypothetical protein
MNQQGGHVYGVAANVFRPLNGIWVFARNTKHEMNATDVPFMDCHDKGALGCRVTWFDVVEIHLEDVEIVRQFESMNRNTPSDSYVRQSCLNHG